MACWDWIRWPIIGLVFPVYWYAMTIVSIRMKEAAITDARLRYEWGVIRRRNPIRWAIDQWRYREV